jgi:hypothetical protein
MSAASSCAEPASRMAAPKVGPRVASEDLLAKPGDACLVTQSRAC